jgi:hypothetical protein
MRWNDPKLHEMAGEFFRLFSRFEYALKANGYMVPDRRDAVADWTRFALDVHPVLEQAEDQELTEALNFILKEPPKKQINRGGVVDWDETPPDSKNQTDLALQYVRRIRNNLFHGGKFNGRWFAPERSGPLIDAGITILNASLKASKGVHDAYHLE